MGTLRSVCFGGGSSQSTKELPFEGRIVVRDLRLCHFVSRSDPGALRGLEPVQGRGETRSLKGKYFTHQDGSCLVAES